MTVVVDVERAARLVLEGQVVAYPTETVYGLGADASSHAALQRLYALKGRDAARRVSVLVAGIEELVRRVPDLPPTARRLAERHWPGPLTLVVPVPGGALDAVRGERGVGFRCSPHPTAAALLRAAGRPLLSTSCNRSGDEPCRSADEVERAFGAELCVAGGEPAGGALPSTVVAVDAGGALELLREGAIPFAELRAQETR
jgi:L-threonylcarbamoyladenylate synthase